MAGMSVVTETVPFTASDPNTTWAFVPENEKRPSAEADVATHPLVQVADRVCSWLFAAISLSVT